MGSVPVNGGVPKKKSSNPDFWKKKIIKSYQLRVQTLELQETNNQLKCHVLCSRWLLEPHIQVYHKKSKFCVQLVTFWQSQNPPIWRNLPRPKGDFPASNPDKWCPANVNIQRLRWHRRCKIWLFRHQSYLFKKNNKIFLKKFLKLQITSIPQNGPQFATQTRFHQHIKILAIFECFVQFHNKSAIWFLHDFLFWHDVLLLARFNNLTLLHLFQCKRTIFGVTGNLHQFYPAETADA